MERSVRQATLCFAHWRGVVPKWNTKFRLIQNLRPVRVVNDSCCMLTFQCEDIKTVAQLIEAEDDLVAGYCRYKKWVPSHQKVSTVHRSQ